MLFLASDWTSILLYSIIYGYLKKGLFKGEPWYIEWVLFNYSLVTIKMHARNVLNCMQGLSLAFFRIFLQKRRQGSGKGRRRIKPLVHFYLFASFSYFPNQVFDIWKRVVMWTDLLNLSGSISLFAEQDRYRPTDLQTDHTNFLPTSKFKN